MVPYAADKISDICGFDYHYAHGGAINKDRFFKGIFSTNIANAADDYQEANFKKPPTLRSQRRKLGKKDYSPDVLLSLAKQYIKQAVEDDADFFLYYPMLLVHSPFHLVPGSKRSAKKFDSMLLKADAIVGEIRDYLRELGVASETLLVVTSDNGDVGSRTSRWQDTRVRGDKFGLSEAATRVPLLIEWPGVVAKGSVSKRLVDLTDFVPTCADALSQGIPSKSGGPLQGHSFLDDMRDKRSDGAADGRQYVFLESNRQSSIRSRTARIDFNRQLYSVAPHYDERRVGSDDLCDSSDFLMLANALTELGLSNPFEVTKGIDARGCENGFTCLKGQLVCARSGAGCAVSGCTRCKQGSSVRCQACDAGLVQETGDGYRCIRAADAEDQSSATTAAAASTTRAQAAQTTPPAGSRGACGGIADCSKCKLKRSGVMRCTRCDAGYAAVARSTKCRLTSAIPCNVQGCDLCVPGKPDRCKRCQPGLRKKRRGRSCRRK